MPFHPFAADLAEPRGDDDQPLDALGHAGLDDTEDVLLGHDDHGQVDGAGNLLDGRPGVDGVNRIGAGVHRVDRPGEAVPQQVVHDVPADGVRAAGGADHRDGARAQDAVEGIHGAKVSPTRSGFTSRAGC